MTGPLTPVVTGYGVFTAFGAGVAALRSGVFGGASAVTDIDRFDTSRFRTNRAATASRGPDGIQPRQLPVLTRCVAEAVEMAGGDAGAAPVLIGSQGDHVTLTEYWRTAAEHGSGRTAIPGLAAELPHRVAESLGLGQPRLAFQNACVASSNAVIHGCRMVANGVAERVVCGGAYLVEEEFFAMFDSGRAFSRDGALRPFSRNRSGLLLGDGAGAVVVESIAAAARRGAPVHAVLRGWGMSADAHHVVRPHPEGDGMARTIATALRRAALVPSDLDYVNAHGTGTPSNDPAETAGLRRVLGAAADGVPVSSTKGATGHMLEATGVVELVITMLALRDGMLPPTVGLDEPDPRCDLDNVPGSARPARLRHAVTLNAGFGGLNSAIVLEAA